jgi:DNA repair exonuclease SbcCD ATPase subunit
MRLVELQVAGFRAFGQKQSFDLDADVVIINGVNGQGKTSFFDALLWGLSGLVPRISIDTDAVLSKFSDTGQSEVTIRFQDSRGAKFLVRRSFDGQQQRVRFESGQDASRDSDAEAKLQNLLWPGAKTNTDPKRAVAEALTRTVYLQQDVLREFLTRDDDKSRFSCIADLIGVAQVSDLREQLDRARTAWSTITNQRAAELEQRENKLASLRNDLQRTEGSQLQVVDVANWNAWWSNASKWISDMLPPSPGQANDTALLDRAIRTLQSQASNLLRQRDLIYSLKVEMDRHAAKLTRADVGELRTNLARLQQQMQKLRERVTMERANEAALQRRRAESAQLREKIALFASLALQLLADRCPVCSQTYDIEATKARLETLSKTPSEANTPDAELSTMDLDIQLQNAVEAAGTAEARLRELELGNQQDERWLATLRSQLAQLGIEVGEDLTQTLAESSSRLQRDISVIEQLIKDGERLSLLLLRLADQSKVKELRAQIASIEQENAATKSDLEVRRGTWELATNVLEALRKSEDDVVQLQLEEINPLLQRIYSRIDPNPVFRTVSLVSTFLKGRGHLNPQVMDSATNARSNSPEQVLSSSQVNALALSLFVALNFGLPKLPLNALLMDDPLQSLDEISLLGVADLLRRAKPARQLLISTHDERFVGLLQRKLRPTQSDERVLTITLSGWSRRGPDVEISVAKPDLQPMRIAV